MNHCGTSHPSTDTPSPAAAEPGGSDGSPRDRAAWWVGLFAVLFVCGWASERDLWRPDAVLGLRENIQIAEAQAWWSGRLDLPERVHDTALWQERVYSYFPPMFTLIAALIVPLFGGVPHPFIVLLTVVVPVLTYVLTYRLTAAVPWTVILTLGFTMGTSAWPVIDHAIRSGTPYDVNHVLAVIGLLLILVEYVGDRRVWPAAIGLVVAALSRQLTIVMAAPVAYMAFCLGPPHRRWHRLTGVATAWAAVLVIYGGLNTVKFGHPLRTGYALNHVGRSDVFAREAGAHGILSLHWVPRNLYYTNLGPPDVHTITMAGEPQAYIKPNTMGTGIWWTTPLLLWIFGAARDLIRDRPRAALFMAAAAVYGLLMLWHATGAVQRGYNRYSLDYLPVVLAVIVPYCIANQRRRWVTLAMIAWSIAYFTWLMRLPHLRVA